MVQVLLVGVVRSVQETSTNLAYTVDDMTGEPITVRKYIQDNEVVPVMRCFLHHDLWWSQQHRFDCHATVVQR